MSRLLWHNNTCYSMIYEYEHANTYLAVYSDFSVEADIQRYDI